MILLQPRHQGRGFSAAFLLAGAVLFASVGLAFAEAPQIQPGEWTITSKTQLNGAATPPSVKQRCFTPEQAKDVAATLGPQFGTVNSACATPVIETTAKTLKWQLQCRGQMDMDVAANFEFDSETRYKAVVVSKATMAGTQLSNSSTEIEAERKSDCSQ